MAKALFLILSPFLVIWPAAAQDREGEVKPYNCESNAITLDTVHHGAGEKGLIIAIARLGDGERRRALNARRLRKVRAYLAESGWRRDPNTIILAEGERVKGYGRVEIYVGGKLLSALAVMPNKDLKVESCASGNIRPKWAEEPSYPLRDAGLRKSKKEGER